MKRMFRRKGEKLSLLILIVGLIIWGLILGFGPNTSKIPARSVAPHWPQQTLSSPLPGSQVSIPTLEPVTVLYIVENNISYRWRLRAVLRGWEKAKYTQLEIVTSCPDDEYCVVVKEDPKIDPLAAAQTLFSHGRIITITLNVKVPNAFVAQSALCHEFGHVLGEGHYTGTTNTCMSPKQNYRVLPTKFDLQTVDSLGQWDPEKMYESSGKTVDMHSQPN